MMPRRSLLELAVYLHPMIWPPLFAVAACWCARMEVLSII